MSFILNDFFVYDDAVQTKSIYTIQILIQLDSLQTKTVNFFHFHFNFVKENYFYRAICAYCPDFQLTQYQITNSYAIPFGLKDNDRKKVKMTNHDSLINLSEFRSKLWLKKIVENN